MDTLRPLLTLEQVAAFLQVPMKTIYAQRTRDDLPGSLGIRVGRHVRFRPEDLERWIAAQTNGRGHG